MADVSTLLGPILKAGLTWLSRRRLPQHSGELHLPGLQAPVEVLRDPWGIPHIYAGNTPDLFRAQGFIHAQDRLWQMEVNRRLAAGRLAEILGPEAVDTDRAMRTLLLRRVAEQEVAQLSADTYGFLEAYAAGVNAYIERKRLPVEFTLLRYRPEPWGAADTVSWIKIMAWYLCADWRDEARRWDWVERLGESTAEELTPPYLDHWPYVIPPGVERAGLEGRPVEAVARQAPVLPSSTEGWGSNNWVLAGSRTTTGSPILANDMHLGLTIPAIWYENHLIGGELDVTGVTFPGIPGVISGHNGHVAWGFTDGLPDVQDLYIEHLHPTGEGRVEVEVPGGRYDAEVWHEPIHVKGSETVYEDVIVTRHGPIINRLLPDLTEAPPLALRWTALEPDPMLDSLMSMMGAQTCLAFREALRGWSTPAQNTVYADVEGNIGYSLPGKIPIRARGDGHLPVPGWTGDHEWIGYIPFEALPHCYNPASGYIASANNAVVDEDYPYELAIRPTSGNRAQRIVELIEGRAAIDLAYVQQMQLDVVSPMARIVVGYIRRLKAGEALAPATMLLRDWGGTITADSAAGAVYEVLLRELAELTLSKVLGAGVPYNDIVAWWLEHLLTEPDAPWFDLGNGETRDDVLRAALTKALARVRSLCGPEPGDWAWGKLHRMIYGHVLGQSKLLAPTFNRGPFGVRGDGQTVCASYQGKLDATSFGGPPYRMIVDLGDLRNSRSVLTPGQSGHPGSPHYDDQIASWTAGEYHPMLYAREDVERRAVNRLRLRG